MSTNRNVIRAAFEIIESTEQLDQYENSLKSQNIDESQWRDLVDAKRKFLKLSKELELNASKSPSGQVTNEKLANVAKTDQKIKFEAQNKEKKEKEAKKKELEKPKKEQGKTQKRHNSVPTGKLRNEEASKRDLVQFQNPLRNLPESRSKQSPTNKVENGNSNIHNKNNFNNNNNNNNINNNNNNGVSYSRYSKWFKPELPEKRVEIDQFQNSLKVNETQFRFRLEEDKKVASDQEKVPLPASKTTKTLEPFKGEVNDKIPTKKELLEKTNNNNNDKQEKLHESAVIELLQLLKLEKKTPLVGERQVSEEELRMNNCISNCLEIIMSCKAEKLSPLTMSHAIKKELYVWRNSSNSHQSIGLPMFASNVLGYLLNGGQVQEFITILRETKFMILEWLFPFASTLRVVQNLFSCICNDVTLVPIWNETFQSVFNSFKSILSDQKFPKKCKTGGKLDPKSDFTTVKQKYFKLVFKYAAFLINPVHPTIEDFFSEISNILVIQNLVFVNMRDDFKEIPNISNQKLNLFLPNVDDIACFEKPNAILRHRAEMVSEFAQSIRCPDRFDSFEGMKQLSKEIISQTLEACATNNCIWISKLIQYSVGNVNDWSLKKKEKFMLSFSPILIDILESFPSLTPVSPETGNRWNLQANLLLNLPPVFHRLFSEIDGIIDFMLNKERNGGAIKERNGGAMKDSSKTRCDFEMLRLLNACIRLDSLPILLKSNNSELKDLISRFYSGERIDNILRYFLQEYPLSTPIQSLLIELFKTLHLISKKVDRKDFIVSIFERVRKFISVEFQNKLLSMEAYHDRKQTEIEQNKYRELIEHVHLSIRLENEKQRNPNDRMLKEILEKDVQVLQFWLEKKRQRKEFQQRKILSKVNSNLKEEMERKQNNPSPPPAFEENVDDRIPNAAKKINLQFKATEDESFANLNNPNQGGSPKIQKQLPNSNPVNFAIPASTFTEKSTTSPTITIPEKLTSAPANTFNEKSTTPAARDRDGHPIDVPMAEVEKKEAKMFVEQNGIEKANLELLQLKLQSEFGLAIGEPKRIAPSAPKCQLSGGNIEGVKIEPVPSECIPTKYLPSAPPMEVEPSLNVSSLNDSPILKAVPFSIDSTPSTSATLITSTPSIPTSLTPIPASQKPLKFSASNAPAAVSQSEIWPSRRIPPQSFQNPNWKLSTIPEHFLLFPKVSESEDYVTMTEIAIIIEDFFKQQQQSSLKNESDVSRINSEIIQHWISTKKDSALPQNLHEEALKHQLNYFNSTNSMVEESQKNKEK